MRTQWDAWVEQSLDPSFFLTYGFLRSAWDSTDTGSELCLVFIHGSDERLLGIAPLKKVHRTMFGCRNTILRLIAEEIAEMHPVIMLEDEKQFCTLFVDYLAASSREWNRLVLNAIDPNSALMGILERRFSRMRRYVVSRGGRSLYLSLRTTASSRDYLSGRKVKFKRKLRYSIKKLAEGASLSLVVVSDPGKIDTALRLYDQLEKRSWKDDALSGINRTPRLRSFYAGLIKSSCEKGWGEMTFLVREDHVIAGGIGILSHQKYCYLQTVYDEVAAPFAPGFVLLTINVCRSLQRGARSIDFMSDYDRYKRFWANFDQECETVIVRKMGVVELLLLVKSHLEDRTGMVRQRLCAGRRGKTPNISTFPASLRQSTLRGDLILDTATLRELLLLGDEGVVEKEDLEAARTSDGPINDEGLRQEVERLIKQRSQERAQRNWIRADEIRRELLRMGIITVDGPDGTRWERK